MSSAQDLGIILEDTPEDVIFPPGDLYSDESPGGNRTSLAANIAVDSVFGMVVAGASRFLRLR